MKNFLVLLLISLTLIACSSRKEKEKESGFAFAEKIFGIFKDLTQEHKSKAGNEIVVNREKLPASFNMAVYFLPPEDKTAKWEWKRNEKDQLITFLRQEKRTARIFELINTYGKEMDLEAIRYMAAQQGAETLLVVRGKSEVDSRLKPSAASYVVLLPMLFVEGNEVRSNFMLQAVLWDVKKPFVHLGVETEGDWKMDRPLAFRQADRAVKKSKQEALANLSQKLRTELSQI